MHVQPSTVWVQNFHRRCSSCATQVKTNVAGFGVVPYTCKSGSKIEIDAVPKIGEEGCGSGMDVTL